MPQIDSHGTSPACGVVGSCLEASSSAIGTPLHVGSERCFHQYISACAEWSSRLSGWWIRGGFSAGMLPGL